jgi:hypothetical protein
MDPDKEAGKLVKEYSLQIISAQLQYAEWLFLVMDSSCAFFILWPTTHVFSNLHPVFSVLSSLLPGWVWGFLLFISALIRFRGLNSNSETLRNVATYLSAVWWLFMAIALISQNSTGLATPMCFVMSAQNAMIYILRTSWIRNLRKRGQP